MCHTVTLVQWRTVIQSLYDTVTLSPHYHTTLSNFHTVTPPDSHRHHQTKLFPTVISTFLHYHIVTLSPDNNVTLSHCHTATIQHCLIATLSHRHHTTLSHCHAITSPPYNTVTLSHRHSTTLSHCHTGTLQHCHNQHTTTSTRCQPSELRRELPPSGVETQHRTQYPWMKQ